MSLDMSSGCLRDYQKGLRPGGTPGSVCSKAGPRPRLFFGNVLTEKFSLHPGVGRKGECVALLSNIIQHSFRSNVLVQSSLWESPYFSPGWSFNLMSGLCLLGVLREGRPLCESPLGGQWP